MRIDGDGYRAFAAHLRGVDVAKVCRPVMTKAGANMRDRARAQAPTGPHLPSYASAIIFNKPSDLVVEVGAMSAGQGPLSSILEYGQGGNAPHPHIVPQLDAETGPTCEWLVKAISEAVAE